ncbi:hypothetical protein AVEN_217568-1 [Araneus ventricosus]|uniref:Uncharacterized protein n=1 Tax=Araneus ventricosus TaxID=182803 RepID=A0A4Y2QUV2_ARAVE|nr:hypothetical protein AVEN_217568-1 [Araneus ventricosus]
MKGLKVFPQESTRHFIKPVSLSGKDFWLAAYPLPKRQDYCVVVCKPHALQVLFQLSKEGRWPSGKESTAKLEVPGSKPDSTEDPSCMGPVASQVIRRRSSVLPLVWCGRLERGALRCRPRHMIEVQNDEVRRKEPLCCLEMER